MVKLFDKPIALVVSVLGGMLAGAIFAVVRAAVGRGAAVGTRKLTGVWPGEQSRSAADEART